jgi:hypothetical protein
MFLFPPDLQGQSHAATEAPDSDDVEHSLPAATRVFNRSAAAISDASEQGRLRVDDPILAALTVWAATHGLAEALNMGFDFDDEFRDRWIAAVIDTTFRGLVIN